MLRTDDDQVWLDTQAAQFLDAVLSRFCFHFFCCTEVRNQRTVDVHDFFAAQVGFHLANRFQEWQGLDIPYCSADFSDDNIRFRRFRCPQKAIFDFIGDVWDDLDRSAKIIAAALFLNNRRIDFPRCHIRIFVQVDVDETLVMAQVQIRFRAVIGYENFSVLVRAHRARVNVDVWIEFLDCDVQSSVFQ